MKILTFIPLLALLSLDITNRVIAAGYPVHGTLQETAYKIQGEHGSGSGGQVMTPSGKKVILTNWHVCETSDDGRLAVKTEYFDMQTILRVVKVDPEHDLCALEGISSFSALKVGKEIKLFHNVYAAGYPTSSLNKLKFVQGYREMEVITELDYGVKGSCLAGFRPTTSRTGAPSCRLSIELIDTSMRCEPGNSGSPVINSKGELVGVINSTNGPHGVMIPLRDIKNFLSDL